MKTQVLPFTCIKRHFEGEIFAPVENGGQFELQSIFSVLIGSNGNAYRFKNEENANVWINSNLIRASKQQVTTQTHIDALIVKNSQTPHDYLQTEIDILNARNAGEWGIYFSDELTSEFGIIAKGDKGDTGLQGIQGDKGDTGLQGIQGVKGDTGTAGANGADGIQGEQGLQGVKGDKGDTGAQGIQGAKGDTGAAGITWQYPIGYTLIDTGDTNPFTFLGYGTWQAFGAGRVLVGQDAAQTEFDVLGETGGEKTHVLSVGEMPSHTHTQDAHSHGLKSNTNGTAGNSIARTTSATVPIAISPSADATTATNQNTGGGSAHNNLQPYIVVKFWKRTA